MAKQTKQSVVSENKSQNKYFGFEEEKAFFDEVDEEVRNEKFKLLMSKYGGFILSILVLAILFAVGYEKIGEWQNKRAEKKTVQYIQAVAENNGFEKSISELEALVNSETSIYRDIAQLQIANILLDNYQTDRALQVLEKIVNDDKISDKIREIAIIKLATYKVDSAKYADMDALLSSLAYGQSAWASMAKELLAMSAIQNNDIAKGKAIYEELLKNEEISEEFRARINDMLASINGVN